MLKFDHVKDAAPNKTTMNHISFTQEEILQQV